MIKRTEVECYAKEYVRASKEIERIKKEMTELKDYVKLNVYFAHSFYHKDSDLEKKVIDLLTRYVFVINPFEYERSFESQYGGTYYENPSKRFAMALVNNDFNLIRKSDLVFAHIDQRQIGTVFEIAYTTLVLQKRVIVVCDQPSPFFLANELITWYPTIEEFEKDLPGVLFE